MRLPQPKLLLLLILISSTAILGAPGCLSDDGGGGEAEGEGEGETPRG